MENITKEEIKKLLEIPGSVRGQVFLTDIGYIKIKKREEGVKLFQNKIKEWNCPIDFPKVKALDWYPAGLRAISLLAAKEVFNWGDKEISNMGYSAPTYSFIVQLLLKYFASLERSFKETPKYWQKHWNVGKLEPYKINKEKKYVIIRLHDFKIHPIICTYLFKNGYFIRIAQYTAKGKNFSSKETKCMFRGDSYHECLISWE